MQNIRSLLDRRKFIAAAAGSLLAMTAPLSVLENPAPGRARWKICAFEKPLQPLSYDELAGVIAELGFDGIEATVRSGGHVLPERVEEDLPRMIEALKRHGLEITVMTTGITAANEPHAEKTLRAAAKLGVKHYRMGYWRYDLRKPVIEQLDAIRPIVRDLVALNRELGITALYQNHAGVQYVGAPIWDIHRLLADHDSRHIAVAYDIRHAIVEGGLSWPIQINLIQPFIGAVFVKDFRWDGRTIRNVPLGEGMVDQKFFGLLKQINFTGPISLHVEYLHGRTREETKAVTEALRKDLATLRSWLG